MFLAFRFTLLCCGFSCYPSSATIDRCTRQVIQGFFIWADNESQIAITELIIHPATLRRQRRDAAQHLHPWNLRVEAEQISRVPVDSVNHVFGCVPDGLPPVICHGSRRRWVIL